MARRPTRSISGPIIYGSVSVALTTALLVGWIYVIVKNQELTQRWAGNLWLLVSGIISFAMLIAVLVLFSVFLARAILDIRRQTTFIDSVTHELRSPLASLRLCLETLARPGLPDPHRERLHEMMHDDVERLAAFIDDILQATRIEHGGKGQVVSPVDLGSLLSTCVTTVCRRHRMSHDDVVIDVRPGLEIDTDAAALEIVMKNLIDNAIKYSDPPANVRINVVVEDRRVRIDVIDQGIGIPRSALRRVFDRFYRVDEEAVRARHGTGLGLYVVNALVRGIGGHLSAHSEGPGVGTRMTVLLPLAKAPTTVASATGAPVETIRP